MPEALNQDFGVGKSIGDRRASKLLYWKFKEWQNSDSRLNFPNYIVFPVNPFRSLDKLTSHTTHSSTVLKYRAVWMSQFRFCLRLPELGKPELVKVWLRLQNAENPIISC